MTVNLWFDRPILQSKFLGFVGGRMQWAFDKSQILADGGGHVSMVSSGADDLLRMENDALTELARAELIARAPAGRQSARLLRSVVVRESRATFSLAPGQPHRPGTVTPLRGFYLAGDWTDTGLPATIEGAVLSGHRAAAAILHRPN